MNIQEAVFALSDKDDSKAISGIEFLTKHLRDNSSSWRDIVPTLPNRVRSNRLDTTVALIDRPNVNEALVAMRKATEMIEKHGLGWGVIFSQQNSSQIFTRSWGKKEDPDTESRDYNNQDSEWDNEEWVRESRKAQNAYEEEYDIILNEQYEFEKMIEERKAKALEKFNAALKDAEAKAKAKGKAKAKSNAGEKA